MIVNFRPLLVLALLLPVAAACGSATDSAGAPEPAPAVAGSAAPGAGVRVIDVNQAADIHQSPPAELVVLDVRTPEEFAAGHLEGAIMIDFYSPDFATDIAELDRDVPYLLYCRSGNRSSQARALMADLGFSDVADLDGGIQAWAAAGLPTIAP